MTNTSQKLKFYACRGMSFSGKSTWAREEAERLGNCVIVTKDDIRAAMGADLIKGIRVKEGKVIDKRNELIMDALKSGKNIISADTNFAHRTDHIANMKALVYPKYRDEYDFEVKDFTDVPFDTILERAKNTTRAEGADYWVRVVKEQKNKFMIPKKLYEDPSYWVNPTLPKAVLVDADGTACIHYQRSPFEFEKCHTDLPNYPLMDILKMYCERDDVEVIVLSGRPDTYRDLTENWFLANGISFDKALMRKAGDMRNDAIVKREIYEAEIKDKYHVYAVFDDRKRVVENLWVAEGLPVFAFGNPYHDF